MLPIESPRPVPAVVTAPTMELLAYAWRFVLARVWLFAGLSGLSGVAWVASFVAGRILLGVMGFHTSSHLMNSRDFLMSGAINAAASALIAVPILAGMYGVIFRMFDNDPDPIKGFSVLQQRFVSVVWVSLLGSAINLVMRFALWSFVSHSFGTFISGIFSLIIGAMVVLAVPAVVRYNLPPLDAFAYSVRRFASRPLPFIGYFLAASVMSVSGALACGVGILFTFAVCIVAPALLLLEPNVNREA
jgi:hypothetical protein